MIVFNEYGNIQVEQTKKVSELIEKTCKKELTRLVTEGASIIEIRAVFREFIVAVDIACSEVIIKEQHRQMEIRASYRDSESRKKNKVVQDFIESLEKEVK
jgi:hypothetical protein